MFPHALQFHIAPAINSFVAWLNTDYGWLFSAINNVGLKDLQSIQAALDFVPWWVWIALVMFLRFRQTRRIMPAIVAGALMMVIGVFGLWSVAMTTLSVMIAAVVVSLIIGIPVGILMAENGVANAVITPILDAMQTMPSFVYLIPALLLFGLGKVPAVFATVLYALPPVVRLTNLGIRQVSGNVLEAAEAFGATRWQLLREVRLPLAMPSILAGVNQTTMMALAMVVIASMVGAAGLGENVLIAINQLQVGQGFEAGLAIVVIAIILDRLTQGAAKGLQRGSSS